MIDLIPKIRCDPPLIMGNPDPHEGKSGNKRSSTVVAAFSTSQMKRFSTLVCVTVFIFISYRHVYRCVYIELSPESSGAVN